MQKVRKQGRPSSRAQCQRTPCKMHLHVALQPHCTAWRLGCCGGEPSEERWCGVGGERRLNMRFATRPLRRGWNLHDTTRLAAATTVRHACLPCATVSHPDLPLTAVRPDQLCFLYGCSRVLTPHAWPARRATTASSQTRSIGPVGLPNLSVCWFVLSGWQRRATVSKSDGDAHNTTSNACVSHICRRPFHSRGVGWFPLPPCTGASGR